MNARCRPIVNLLSLRPDEQIAATVPVREFREDQYLIFATRKGIVKKTALSACGNVRVVGDNAINDEPDDELIDVQISAGEHEVIHATHTGTHGSSHERA